VQLLYACGVNYYQNGIVIDSTGHTANIQGTILHACNFNMCMQGIRVLGTCLQLTLEGCQYEGFGSAIHAEGADTVVVRDSLFFTTTSASMAIAAQLPQDVFVGQGGGNWWIEANRFILQPSSTVRYIFNLTSSFNAGAFRDNVIWAQGATATGAFNLASGTANVVESGTVFEFWNAAWPYWTNANSGGGIGNLCSFGALATTSNLSATQWQNQGAYVCWNLSGGILGGTNFVNSRGGGGGGFGFYDTASTIGSTPTLLANINSTGINNAPIGIGTPAAGSFTTLAASGTVSGTGFSNFLASPPAIGGTTPAAGKFTTVTANSATFAGGAAQVTADTVLAEIAVGVAGLANISGTQWQQQGAWSGWNFQGTSGLNGETDFINSRGGGSGGSSPQAHPAALRHSQQSSMPAAILPPTRSQQPPPLSPLQPIWPTCCRRPACQRHSDGTI
jgi:hypothetical protein